MMQQCIQLQIVGEIEATGLWRITQWVLTHEKNESPPGFEGTMLSKINFIGNVDYRGRRDEITDEGTLNITPFLQRCAHMRANTRAHTNTHIHTGIHTIHTYIPYTHTYIQAYTHTPTVRRIAFVHAAGAKLWPVFQAV